MKPDEMYVRERWESDAKIPINQYTKIVLDHPYWFRDDREDCQEVWSAARAFTEQRKEEIRQKQREIEWVQMFTAAWDENHDNSESGFMRDNATGYRIEAVLESQLADLKRGMK